MTHFHAFCSQYDVVNPFPVCEQSLCRFTVYLADKGLAPQSIQTYLSAVRDAHLAMGFPDPRDRSSFPVLRRVQAGIKRLRAAELPHRQRIRLPITLPVLRSIREQLDVSRARDRELTWAVASLAFFGFFRLGELLPESEEAYARATHLSWGDVAINNAHQPTMLKIHLKRSKCDQFGRGTDVFVGRTTDEICPVAATLAYFAVRGGTEGPLFIDAQRKPLTKAKFVGRIRDILGEAGYAAYQFAGHSFRIGAATTAAQAGLEDSTIQALGRWHSAAFLAYIRMPKERLAGISARLASSIDRRPVSQPLRPE